MKNDDDDDKFNDKMLALFTGFVVTMVVLLVVRTVAEVWYG